MSESELVVEGQRSRRTSPTMVRKSTGLAALVAAVTLIAGWPGGAPTGSTVPLDSDGAFDSLSSSLRHSFHLALPGDWTLVITLEAAPGYRLPTFQKV